MKFSSLRKMSLLAERLLSSTLPRCPSNYNIKKLDIFFLQQASNKNNEQTIFIKKYQSNRQIEIKVFSVIRANL